MRAPFGISAAPIVATVTADTPAEECARLERHYSLTQIPVVDDDRLTGVILAESLLSATVEQDTRQMQQVANVAGETVDGPLADSIRTPLALAYCEPRNDLRRGGDSGALRVDAGPDSRTSRVPSRSRRTGRKSAGRRP